MWYIQVCLGVRCVIDNGAYSSYFVLHTVNVTYLQINSWNLCMHFCWYQVFI